MGVYNLENETEINLAKKRFAMVTTYEHTGN